MGAPCVRLPTTPSPTSTTPLRMPLSGNCIPAPQSHRPAPVADLPPPPDIDEASVFRAVRRMNPEAAAGPDRMSPRLLRLLATTSISPEAGVTGLSALTRLVRRLARGISLSPRPDKIRPLAIGQSLRRLVAKVLLPSAIADTRPLLHPEQLANAVPSGLDAIVHDARMLTRRQGRDSNYVMVSIDARNAFNSFSRQRMLNALPSQAPTLARFIDMIYARTPPPLVLPSSPPITILSEEGVEQGCPDSMLLHSLAAHPLVRRISQECDLDMNRWFADDGTLIGRIEEVAKALSILCHDGPAHQFFISPSKTRAFWPTVDPARLALLTSFLPLDLVSDGGIRLLGAPIGSPSFMASQVEAKLAQCDATLRLIEPVPDARIRFHLHRVTAAACRVHHLFRLISPDFSLPFAHRFDESQMAAYSRFNNVPLSADVTSQIRLPFRLGGHGFDSVAATVHASYVASLIESAPARLAGPRFPSVSFYRRMVRGALRVVVQNLPPSVQPPNFPLTMEPLGCLEPEALAKRPERTHYYLIQAHRAAAAAVYWQNELWRALPDPTDHSVAVVRRRARYYSITAPGASAFLTAHPASASQVNSPQWSLMLRRHLDVPVYDDSLPLRCPHCAASMDPHGDHAADCKTGYGSTHRHNIVRNAFARTVFGPAGLAYSLEVPSLLPGIAHRPADILVQPAIPPPGSLPDKPTAYDVTVRSPYVRGVVRRAASRCAGAAEVADASKLRAHQRTVRDALQLQDTHPVPPLDWHFVPLPFDTFAAPSAQTLSVVDHHARRIADRRSCAVATARARIQQQLSFAI